MTPETDLWALSVDELRGGYATRPFSPSEVIDELSRDRAALIVARRIHDLVPRTGSRAGTGG